MFDIEYKGGNTVVISTKKSTLVTDPKMSLWGDVDYVVKDAIELAFTSERNAVTTEDIIKSIENTHSLKVIMSKSIDDMIKMYKEKKFKNASK